jgi:hypothetical protein
MIFDKRAKATKWGKTDCSENIAATIRHSHANPASPNLDRHYTLHKN